jgi:predicted nucleic acid-binding protein
MHSFYLDASALAKRYVIETGSSVVNYLFTRVTADRIHVFNVGIAEVASVLVRKRNTGKISTSLLTQGLSDLIAEILQPTIPHKLQVNNDLVLAALPLIETHSLNGTDAIVLRSALDLAVALTAGGDNLVLTTSDQRLERAAQSEGLPTFNPETQDQPALDALLTP